MTAATSTPAASTPMGTTSATSTTPRVRTKTTSSQQGQQAKKGSGGWWPFSRSVGSSAPQPPAKDEAKAKKQRISAARKEVGRKGGLANGNSAGTGKRQKNQANDSAVVVGVESQLRQPCTTTSTKRKRPDVSRPDLLARNKTMNKNSGKQRKKAQMPRISRKTQICPNCGPKPATQFCPRNKKNSDFARCHDCATHRCRLNESCETAWTCPAHLPYYYQNIA